MSHIILKDVCLNYKVKKDIKFRDLILGNRAESNFSKMSGDGIIRALNEINLELRDGDGFDMDASGWENIRLRGIMLGLKPQEIESKVQEIAEFSELGDYLDIPVKYYSSGMFVRLSFSVSTSINPDILLLDEVLAAGDAKFVDKANKRVNEMMKSAKILVLVTHSMESAVKFCNKAILLKKGEILKNGAPQEVVDYYLSMN